MNRILGLGAFAFTGFLALAGCNSPAQPNESANATAAATNQAARDAAREMHNEMTANDMDDQHAGMSGMGGMKDMHDMGNMQGGAMNKTKDAPMNSAMPMEDESKDM